MEIDERWHGSLIQISDAMDENDWTLPSLFFVLGRPHIDKEADDQSDRISTYHGIRATR